MNSPTGRHSTKPTCCGGPRQSQSEAHEPASGESRSVKVKRLFLWFADRHSHAWFERLDCNGLDRGRGKRMLFKGGKLDSKYWITVLKESDNGR